MRMTTRTRLVRLTLLPLSLGIVVGLTACGADSATAPTRTVTATITNSASPTEVASPAEVEPTTTAKTDEVDTPRTPAQPCGPRDLSRTTINAAIAAITPDPLGAWVPRESNFSTCNAISYVVLENGGGMAASDDQLLIFGQQGNFLGTGITCITSRQNVRTAGHDFVTVDYSPDRWITTPTGEHTRPIYPVTFRWNGSRVLMEGTLPYEITQGRC